MGDNMGFKNKPACIDRKHRRENNVEQLSRLIQKYDYENFLCTLLLPEGSRSSAFAVRAFNIELAQVRDLVTDKTVGLMRFQFWKDVLDEVYMGTPRAAPVAMALTHAINKHKLTKRWFANLIDGREEHIEDQPFTKVQEVEDYADKTNTATNYLILETLGVKDVNADHAASHLGKVQGLVTLVRSISYHAQRNRVILPIELLIKYNVSQQDVIRGCREQKMKDLVYDITSQAHIHLEIARSFNKDVPKVALPALLPMVCAEAYLKSIQKADFDIFDGRLRQRNNWLPLLLWLKKRKKSY